VWGSGATGSFPKVESACEADYFGLTGCGRRCSRAPDELLVLATWFGGVWLRPRDLLVDNMDTGTREWEPEFELPRPCAANRHSSLRMAACLAGGIL